MGAAKPLTWLKYFLQIEGKKEWARRSRLFHQTSEFVGYFFGQVKWIMQQEK